MAILVTGGAGYIGSHVCVELIKSGYEVVIVDNLVNSEFEAIKNIRRITSEAPEFYLGNVENESLLEFIMYHHNIETVIHLAGYKSVSESVENPLKYYDNNIAGLVTLLKVMEKYNVKNLIFSSSATVYGATNDMPLRETQPLKAISPYGSTKLISEQILLDLFYSDNDWNIIIFRYFNPVGADASGMLGENPKGEAQNLMPKIGKVAIGEEPCLFVYGFDYQTKDGTAVRDYIHITDIAKAHIKGIERLLKGKGLETYNLGTGKGHTVLEVIKAYERACGHSIPYRMAERRNGDVAVCYCDASKAERELGWKAEKSLDEMCEDSWRWEKWLMKQ